MVKSKGTYNATGRRLTETAASKKSGSTTAAGLSSDNGVRSNVRASRAAASSEDTIDLRDTVDRFHNRKHGSMLAGRSVQARDALDSDGGDEDEGEDLMGGSTRRHMAAAGARGGASGRRGAAAYDQGDMSDDDDEQYEEALGLGLDDEDDDDEDDEDEDDDVDEDDAATNAVGGWGSKRRDYYNADDAEEQAEDSEDEENMERDEEQEALRLQRQQAALLDEDAMDVDDSLGARARQQASGATTASSKKPLKASAASKKAADSALLASGEDVAIEAVARDISKLSQTEKLELIVKDSPELLELLSDFKLKIGTVVSQIQPLIEKTRRGEFATSSGVSYLEVKLHILLSYCIDICFYLLLKAEGKPVKDHPVIEHLVHLRTTLERLRPLDSKLKYQIDKLVKAAATGTQNSADPLRFKANPAALLADGAEEERGGSKSLRGKRNADASDEEDEAEVAKYVAPKLSAVAFDDDSASQRKQTREDKLRRKALKSSLLRDIQEEFSDRPREVRDTAGFGGRDILPDEDQEEERRRFEESHFVRLTTKKGSGQKRRLPNALDEIVDFGDINGLERFGRNAAGNDDEDDDAELRKVFKKSSIRDKLNELRNNRDDATEVGRSSKRARVQDEEIEEDDYYKEIEAKTLREKDRKAATKAAHGLMAQDDGEEETEGKRAITYQISKNKGLTPKRRKEVRNPRVKHRVSYERALVKRKSQTPSVQTESKRYGGESTGIRSTLARSVKLG
ncbi:hypothetical protein CAOG_05638 [Capsaspora owczarzaki ATCC 30864]|uniref:Sas10 C-terminal domain-containing protein n=1 Tax=Capsaspora owczarzaki (strain ATCC 30864) TaxID=595528 RepID=A0A0D2VUV2_CAPO3|nr:hypothetical protein CAOG_05638 [Capsaspora owczarzaki ATCC 30864]KJE95157.1 hypothetical protein CAOG_005638 [Capsaspora owczarzaki ATCC 30864]|eukprot:XP_004346311.2 hypothetical protein CAOG_05638 [Capsaspora owczarzaki ATCC 30864]